MSNHLSLLAAWDDAEGVRRASELFLATYGGPPDGVWAAPGRVNLIGEHLDYNGGFSLPFALPHRTFVALARRDDEFVRLVSDLGAGEPWTGSLDDLGPGRAAGIAYAGGPAWVPRDEGLPVGGFDAAIASCVPLGAGLSSSAALETAVALALDELFHDGTLGADDAGRTRLAAACVRAENEVAGAATGGMDQAAALRTTAGQALPIDSHDASVRQVPLHLDAAGLAVLVVDTRAPHALADGQYASLLRAACERAAARLAVRTPCEAADPERRPRAAGRPGGGSPRAARLHGAGARAPRDPPRVGLAAVRDRARSDRLPRLAGGRLRGQPAASSTSRCRPPATPGPGVPG